MMFLPLWRKGSWRAASSLAFRLARGAGPKGSASFLFRFSICFFQPIGYTCDMNEQLEINGDEREEVEAWLEANEPYDIDAHYLDWCERNGIVPDLVPDGIGTDPSGEPVNAWRFA